MTDLAAAEIVTNLATQEIEYLAARVDQLQAENHRLRNHLTRELLRAGESAPIVEGLRALVLSGTLSFDYAPGPDLWTVTCTTPQGQNISISRDLVKAVEVCRKMAGPVASGGDKGECGQGMFHDPDHEGEKTAGWFQPSGPEAITETLAPLVHWRLCHIYDWLYFEKDRHGYNVDSIAVIYGEDEVRTGCIGCNLASKDTALLRLIKTREWAHLHPLLELRELFEELVKPKWRLRKSDPEYLKSGEVVRNVQRLGPLTMEARAYGLGKVLDIQRRARVDLINAEEQARIKELWTLNTWPDKWNGDEITGDVLIDAMKRTKDGEIAIQALLVR